VCHFICPYLHLSYFNLHARSVNVIYVMYVLLYTASIRKFKLFLCYQYFLSYIPIVFYLLNTIIFNCFLLILAEMIKEMVFIPLYVFSMKVNSRGVIKLYNPIRDVHTTQNEQMNQSMTQK